MKEFPKEFYPGKEKGHLGGQKTTTTTKKKKPEDSIYSTFDQAASSTEMPFLTARPTQPFESSSEIIASKQSSLTNAHTLTSC